MNLREAAQQALEALEMSTRFVYADNRPQCENAINALRAALAEDRSADIGETSDHFRDATKMIEPVAYTAGYYANFPIYVPSVANLSLPVGTALYTAPPKREPLTDAEIGSVAADIWGSILIAPQSYQQFARAIERAHGIGGEE